MRRSCLTAGEENASADELTSEYIIPEAGGFVDSPAILEDTDEACEAALVACELGENHPSSGCGLDSSALDVGPCGATTVSERSAGALAEDDETRR